MATLLITRGEQENDERGNSLSPRSDL